MGGHGGLNILPQKRWNVYGRENRLKVAQDEAKYEEKQAELRERAEAADRERRRQLLLDRARQRYGDHQALETAEGSAGALDYPTAPVPAAQQQPGQQLEWQQAPAADEWEPDTVALKGLAGGQADHFGALEQQQYGEQYSQQYQQQYSQQQQQQQQVGQDEGGSARAARKKQRRGKGEQSAAVGAAAAPFTLAQLASQLDAPGSQQQQQQQDQQLDAASGEGGEGGEAGQQLLVGSGSDGTKLKRFNLFAEEEALAAKRKNPEVEAEKRDERRRRGNVDTQTSDARFDEQFMFGHKLYGQQAVPWYAKRGSTLPSEAGGSGESAQQQQQLHGSGRRQMWKWEMQARAALVGGNLPGQQDRQRQQEEEKPAAGGLLLGGVTVVHPATGRAANDTDSSSSSSSSSSDSDSGSSSGSGSSSSDDTSSSSSSSDSGSGRKGRSSRHQRRRGSKGKRRGRRKDGSSLRRAKKIKDNKKERRSKERGKRERRSKSSGGSGGGKKGIEQLRLERLKREEAERQRQQGVLAVAAGRDPALEGKKYYQGYGFGRR